MINEKEIISLIHKHAIQQISTTVIVDEQAIHKSIGLAKGDIITFTGPETPSRLAVGLNNQILIADNSRETGIKWTNLISSMIDDFNESVGDSVANLIINGNITTWVYNDPANTLKVDINYNSTNLIITNNALNTVQDIAPNSTPTFNQLLLNNAGTNTNNAVRADRTINTTAPIIGGGNLTANRNLALSYETTNLRLTNNALNTIQDIATNSTPTFNQLLLNNAGTNTNNAVRADRTINTTAPITGGGNLTANRTLELSYNTTNLRLTENSLNTIQDIATNSTPTFSNIILSGLTLGYLPFKTNTTLSNSPVYTNGTDVGIGTTNLSYRLDVSGTGHFTQDLTLDQTVKQYGTSGINVFRADIHQQGDKSLYNNFTSGWTGSGWRLDYGITNTDRAHLELDDLTVRGTMRVYELIINQIRATNGSLFVSSSAKVETVSRQTSEPQYSITFEDPEGHNLCPFLPNDIIIVQRVRLDSHTIVKLIVLQVTNVTGRTIQGITIYEFGQIEKGDLAVRIGSTTNTARQGSVYLTSDDSNAPYIDIVDGVNSWGAWGSPDKLKVRLGRLTGVTDSFFGQLSGYGLYAKSNAYLRGKIYAEQGGWIAGWSIDSNKLTSPLVNNNHQITLKADNNNSIIGVYLGANLGGSNPLYLSYGRVQLDSNNYSQGFGLSAKDEVGNDYFELSTLNKHIAGWNFTAAKLHKGSDIELNSESKLVGVNSNKVKMFYSNSNSWGLEGRSESNNLVFQLGSTNQIAGWEFTSEKLYKDTVSLESAPSMMGFVVDSDKIRIGKFPSDVLTNHYSDISFFITNGYHSPAINEEDTAWGVSGYYERNGIQYPPGFTLLNNYINIYTNNEVNYWTYNLKHRMFEHLSYIIGRTIKLAFKTTFTLGDENLAYSGGLLQVAIRYYNSNWGTNYRQVIYSEIIPDSINGIHIIDKTGDNSLEFQLPANIPDTETVYIEFIFEGGAQTGLYYPYNMELTDLCFYGYVGYKTWINEEGFQLYNSPTNYINLCANNSEINVPNLFIRNKKPIRNHGRLSLPPEVDVELGDIFIDERGVIFMCYAVDNLGVPQWKEI